MEGNKFVVEWNLSREEMKVSINGLYLVNVYMCRCYYKLKN